MYYSSLLMLIHNSSHPPPHPDFLREDRACSMILCKIISTRRIHLIFNHKFLFSKSISNIERQVQINAHAGIINFKIIDMFH
jgi:hypothetical protein